MIREVTPPDVGTAGSARDLFRMTGRAALVTGAARGLGRAMALALADAGADVAAVDTAPLDSLAREVEERGVRCVHRRASGASAYVTGTVLSVDGGWLAR